MRPLFLFFSPLLLVMNLPGSGQVSTSRRDVMFPMGWARSGHGELAAEKDWSMPGGRMQTGQVLPLVCVPEVRCTSVLCTRVYDCAFLLMRFYYKIFSIMIREVLGILNLDPSSPFLCATRQVT